ncbi:RNA-guided endonuclease TnpB family protein [Serratia sp. DD3]|uniref:RNA-guided endonuclease InsQ/TnpB family protein n=1 Tax=Serratia sp. DD3 TaxID=1410619 RepID=UPI0003C506AC|nr:RNA-guided endonuclease TnpB family protein [Serratia sp. DD3]KEY61003.1 putative transposase [Serratia sp. DD3]
MLTGIKLRANPNAAQKQTLSQWMGCARVIWNGKVDEEKYHRTYARKYCTIGTYPPIDQKTAQFKSEELTPWLSDCPSQILRNSAVNWYQTYRKFMKGQCGRPKRKIKSDKGSIYLTRELFNFELCSDGNVRLFIGTKTNNIGYLSFKAHSKFEKPNSLYVRKARGHYYVSFCYENGVDESTLSSNAEHLAFLQGASREFLEQHTIGIDRGVAIAAQAGEISFDFSARQKRHLSKADRYLHRLQRKLAKQQKGANRRTKTQHRISVYHGQKSNIRRDFNHQTSRALVNSPARIFVFEALRTAQMTRRPKAKLDGQGRFLPNKAKQKAGLNKAILHSGWHMLESFTKYKAYQAGKAFFKIPATYTSQECAVCGNIHPNNRKSQSLFVCGQCGNTDNADHNASLVIKKRAITLILDSGTELSAADVLTASADIGRGGKGKTGGVKSSTSSSQRSVKREKVAVSGCALGSSLL